MVRKRGQRPAAFSRSARWFLNMTETTKKVVLDVDFTFGDIVFMRMKSERVAGMVTRFSVTKRGITYGVTWSDNRAESWHFDYELTTEYVPDYTEGQA